jgi:hypothetical protein
MGPVYTFSRTDLPHEWLRSAINQPHATRRQSGYFCGSSRTSREVGIVGMDVLASFDEVVSSGVKTNSHGLL